MATACLLTKRAKFQTPAKLTVPGLLSVHPSHVRWQASDPGTEQDILVVLSAITNQQRAKGKPFLRLVSGPSAHVFEFETEADRDMAVDCIAKAQQPPDQDTPGLPPLQERQALMKADPDLAEEYEQMVRRGVLKEAEFWQGKSRQLLSRPCTTAPRGPPAAGTKTGIPNRMIDFTGEQDTRMAAVGKSKLNFNLTAEMITQIFAERPHVKQAYVKNVPNNMSEKEFWTRYTKHEFAKEVRRKRLLGGDDVEDVPDDHADLFRPLGSGGTGGTAGGGGTGRRSAVQALQEAREGGGTKRSKLGRVNPVINLLAHLHDGFSSGANKDHGLPSQPSYISGDLLRDINRHAEVVLAGVDALERAAATDQAPSAGRGRRSKDSGGSGELSPAELAVIYHREGYALDDLKAPTEEEFEELNIPDARRYFDRLSGSETAATASAGVRGGWASDAHPSSLSLLSTLDPIHLSPYPMDPRRAYQVLLECSRGSESVEVGLSSAPSRLADEVLAPEVLSMIRREVLAANELCRHFWACVPPNTEGKVDKADRLYKEADRRYSQVESMCSVAKGPERAVIRQLLRPVRDMFDILIERYRADQAARGSHSMLQS